MKHRSDKKKRTQWNDTDEIPVMKGETYKGKRNRLSEEEEINRSWYAVFGKNKKEEEEEK